MKFCLPARRFLMGRTENKNRSFIAIRMKIFFFHDPQTGAGGYAQIYDCYVLCYSGAAAHSSGALIYLKT